MTSDNVGQREQTQTHRKVPLDESQQLIMAQIEKGEDLLNKAKSIRSKERLRAAKSEYTNWRKYTADLLKRKIFNTDELANEFAPQFDEYGWLFAPDTPTALQDDLDRDLLRLRSIYERLEFYPERAPQPTLTEDEASKKRGPMDRFASGMGEVYGDKAEQVFISHATEDTQFAHRLADDFQRLGVQVWVAPESIRPGEGWVEAIERGLAESSHMVVVLTPAALESEWVRKETDVAIAQECKGLIQVIPLDVEPCEAPLLLGSYQMVSFRRNYDTSLSQLVDILGVRVTPSEPVRPPRQVPHQQ